MFILIKRMRLRLFWRMIFGAANVVPTHLNARVAKSESDEQVSVTLDIPASFVASNLERWPM